jgi:hypothetical protein
MMKILNRTVLGLGLAGCMQQAKTQTIQQNSFNDQGNNEHRLQVKSEKLTATAISDLEDKSSVGLKLSNEILNFEIDYRRLENVEEVKIELEKQFSNNDKLAVGSILSDQDPYFYLTSSLNLSEKTRVDLTIDSEADFRLRGLWKDENQQLSLTVGKQDDSPLASFSYNNRDLWVSARVGQDSLTGARIALGKIKPEISDNFEAYKAVGRNELPRFQDMHSGPINNSLGSQPEFLFGGRSPLTFLDQTPGAAAVLVDWRKDIKVSAELALRLTPATAVMPGAFYNFPSETAGFSFEISQDIRKHNLRARAEVDESGECRFGVLSTIRF